MASLNIGEAGDQRNYKDSEVPGRPDYEQGKENSHQPNDSSTSFPFAKPRKAKQNLDGRTKQANCYLVEDERSIANRLANEERKLNREEPQTEEAKASKEDPTLPVCA